MLLLAFPDVADDVDTANVTVAFGAFVAVVTINCTVAGVYLLVLGDFSAAVDSFFLLLRFAAEAGLAVAGIPTSRLSLALSLFLTSTRRSVSGQWSLCPLVYSLKKWIVIHASLSTRGSLSYNYRALHC
jgi:hypothetical protein